MINFKGKFAQITSPTRGVGETIAERYGSWEQVRTRA